MDSGPAPHPGMVRDDPADGRTGPPAAVCAGDRSEDDRCMTLALEEARRAGEAGEVPVGAVVVREGEVLGAAGNALRQQSDPTAHAEIRALRRAGRAAGACRLPGATLYVTLEPCLMCLGAAVHARVDRIVYGAEDPKVGATGLLAELPASGRVVNHHPELRGGFRAAESAELLRSFFRKKR